MNVEPFPTFSGDCRLAKTCFNLPSKRSVKRVPRLKPTIEGTRLIDKPTFWNHASTRSHTRTDPAHVKVHAGRMQTIQTESFSDDLTDQAITLIPAGEQIPYLGIIDLSTMTPYNEDTKKLNALRSRQEVARSSRAEVLLP
jgi:hypothetical protein